MESILVPAVIALVTALANYLFFVRRMSGKIKTTDADKLWAEAESIREDCRKQLERAHERIDALEAENKELREQVSELQNMVKGRQSA